MNSNKEIGIWAEDVTAKYFKNKGYKILERNYKKKFGEIDIICEKDGIVTFCEVKGHCFVPSELRAASNRESIVFGPEIRVNRKKRDKLSKLAEFFLRDKGLSLETPWQIDVVAVSLNFETRRAKIKHFENI